MLWWKFSSAPAPCAALGDRQGGVTWLTDSPSCLSSGHSAICSSVSGVPAFPGDRDNFGFGVVQISFNEHRWRGRLGSCSLPLRAP